MPAVDPILKRLRALCLGFPDVEETTSWGHPNWRTKGPKGRMFATWSHYRGKDCICFQAELGLRDVLVRDPRFWDAGFSRGEKTWMALDATGRLDWKEIEDLVGRSYRLVTAPRPRAAPKKKAPRPAVPARRARR
jgi:predicted DNA-binding protein (MmcQ/YjbR family)